MTRPIPVPRPLLYFWNTLGDFAVGGGNVGWLAGE